MATAAVMSTGRAVRWSTIATRSVGRSPARSCARTAIRRASCRDRWWTSVMAGTLVEPADGRAGGIKRLWCPLVPD